MSLLKPRLLLTNKKKPPTKIITIQTLYETLGNPPPFFRIIQKINNLCEKIVFTVFHPNNDYIILIDFSVYRLILQALTILFSFFCVLLSLSSILFQSSHIDIINGCNIVQQQQKQQRSFM